MTKTPGTCWVAREEIQNTIAGLCSQTRRWWHDKSPRLCPTVCLTLAWACPTRLELLGLVRLFASELAIVKYVIVTAGRFPVLPVECGVRVPGFVQLLKPGSFYANQLHWDLSSCHDTCHPNLLFIPREHFDICTRLKASICYFDVGLGLWQIKMMCVLVGCLGNCLCCSMSPKWWICAYGHSGRQPSPGGGSSGDCAQYQVCCRALSSPLSNNKQFSTFPYILFSKQSKFPSN